MEGVDRAAIGGAQRHVHHPGRAGREPQERELGAHADHPGSGLHDHADAERGERLLVERAAALDVRDEELEVVDHAVSSR